VEVNEALKVDLAVPAAVSTCVDCLHQSSVGTDGVTAPSEALRGQECTAGSRMHCSYNGKKKAINRSQTIITLKGVAR